MTTFEICWVRHNRNPAHCWRDFNFPLYSFVREQGASLSNSKLIMHRRADEGSVLHKACYTTLFSNIEIKRFNGPTHPLERENIKIIREDGSTTNKETFFKNYLSYLPEWRKFILKKLNLSDNLSSRKEVIILDTGFKRKIVNLVDLRNSLRKRFNSVNIIQLGKWPLEKQIKAILTAKIVLGLHGAAFYQCLFSNPETIFFEIMPYGFEWDYFKVLTEAKGGKHYQYWHPDHSTNKHRLKSVANHVDVSRPFNDRTRPRLQGIYQKQTKEQWLHRYHRDGIITLDIKDFEKYLFDQV